MRVHAVRGVARTLQRGSPPSHVGEILEIHVSKLNFFTLNVILGVGYV